MMTLLVWCVRWFRWWRCLCLGHRSIVNYPGIVWCTQLCRSQTQTKKSADFLAKSAPLTTM